MTLATGHRECHRRSAGQGLSRTVVTFFKLPPTTGYLMQVNLSQQFEAESLKRMIDATTDVHELQSLARELTDLYFRQRAATAWVVSEQ